MKYLNNCIFDDFSGMSGTNVNIKNMDNKINSPCIRNCCLDKRDICIGCGRTLEEIKGWQAATKSEKMDILEKSAKRRKPLSLSDYEIRK